MSGRVTRNQTQVEWFADQALAAWRIGQAAMAAGQIQLARRWFERARRFAPDDATVALSLATVKLHQQDPQAERLFFEVTTGHDLREAWLGLAACRAQRDDWRGAATALAQALSRHSIPDPAQMAPLADRIAQQIGAPAWCCLSGDGLLHIGGRTAARSRNKLIVWLDDVCLRAPPRKMPQAGRRLAIRQGDASLLGSPLALDRFRALEGFVETRGGGLAGWAWHPADQDTDAKLTIRTQDGRKRLTLTAADTGLESDRPLARPRRFTVPQAAFVGWNGPVHVTGVDGRDLPGSPLDLNDEAETAGALAQNLAAAMPAIGRAQKPRQSPDMRWLAISAGLTGPAPRAPRTPQRNLAVVVPVYRDAALTLACLEAVAATMPPRTRVIVVDDATPEPALAAALDSLAQRGAIKLVRHPANRGFPAAANSGLRAAALLRGGPDIVLLNADALVNEGALQALRAVVHASRDIGTATPLSNDATIVSYPNSNGNPMPAPPELRRLGRLAERANAGIVVDVPTAVGFCMYIRRECLAQVGLFRETVFAQGYGEENDFSLRARHLGWRHVVAAGVFVGHAGGASFRSLAAARRALMARNLAILERLHPGYQALIAAHLAADPLAPARRRLDAARWSQRRRKPAAAVILVTHDSGGGVERVIRDRCATLAQAGKRAIVLRPVRDPNASSADTKTYQPGLCEVCDGDARDTPNLRFHLPSELDTLARLLRPDRPEHVEFHHLLGHDPAVLDLAARLGIPWQVMIHDYAWFCPRVTLLSPQRQYCGEPTEPAICEACIADAGRNDESDLSVVALRARSLACLQGARRVVAPSTDAASRIRRHFPTTRPETVPLERDADLPNALASWASPAGKRRIAVVGAIGAEKGYDVLLACARDAAWRRLALEFIIIGHTVDDARLLATGSVFVTGPYREAEAVQEIVAQSPDFAFLPSIWPETWCFTLGEAWRAGLCVAAFDIGAPAERIRRTGRGWLLPLGLPPSGVNDGLLALRPPNA